MDVCDARDPQPTRRVGSVRFLNARPLVDGLADRPGLEIHEDVPSRLLDELLADRVDVALCPVIDFQTAAQPLRLVPVGGIGSDGPTLTVRLYSQVPPEQIQYVQIDPDSHTSIVLLQIILADRYDRRPRLIEPGAAPGSPPPQAMLLIGDKVITRAPDAATYPHQLDLGLAWKQMTGLPFVFAIWMARADTDLGPLPQELDEQRRRNVDRLDQIAARLGPAEGWPVDLARRYLGEMLRYETGSRQLQAIERFWQRAYELHLIPHQRPLALYPLDRAGAAAGPRA